MHTISNCYGRFVEYQTFEKIFNDSYLNFLKNIFLKLINNNLKIPEDWISNKVLKLENYNGDIPELSLKISQIRTWTYISNHQSWLTDPKYWQEKLKKLKMIYLIIYMRA